MIGVSYNLESEQIFVCYGNGSFASIDARERQERQIFSVNHPVNIVDFSKDFQYVACAGGNGTIEIFDLNSGKNIAKLEGHTKKINSLSFSFDDSLLASASLDETVNVWDLEKRDFVSSLWNKKKANSFNCLFC